MNRPTPRPGILDIEPYVGGASQAPGAARVIKLSSNETPLGPSPHARAAYHDAAAKLHRYPDGHALALRHALAVAYDLPIGQIVCGAGSDEIIQLLCHAYLAPGDEILYSAHGFLIYKIAAQAAGARATAVPETGCTADVDALLGHLGPRTRIVFLANPNNPTGTYLPAQELARLHAGLPEHVLLVIDAAYAEYADMPDYDPGAALVARAGNVVMTRTFSKIFGLAALRVGWAFCPPAVADVLNRVRGPFNVNGPAQAAAVAALADHDWTAAAIAHNTRWRAWLFAECRKLGLDPLPSAGNFLLLRFPARPGRSAIEADAFLMRRGIILRRVAAYGFPNALRLSVGTEEENRLVLAALADFLDGADD